MQVSDCKGKENLIKHFATFELMFCRSCTYSDPERGIATRLLYACISVV